MAIAKFRYNADAEPNMEAEWAIVDYDQWKDKRDKYRWGIEDEDDSNNPMARGGGSVVS